MTALKAEAQAFVDKYKLNNYKNENITVIITGIGSDAMHLATQNVLKKFKDDDKIINVGICGASKRYKIGELIDAKEHKITCIDYEATSSKYEIVDMESEGFMRATTGVKNSYIFKVVSDHFEPKTVTKDKAKKLIFDNIEEMMQRISDA
jgi:nucleoside phosphorylase